MDIGAACQISVSYVTAFLVRLAASKIILSNELG